MKQNESQLADCSVGVAAQDMTNLDHHFVCETSLMENKRVWKSVGIALAWRTCIFLALGLL